MIFFWVWTLSLLGITLSGLRIRLTDINISWLFYLWVIMGVLLFGDFIVPVGHEAEYLPFFQGQLPRLGDTSLYPSMQIWWWSWSFLEPICQNPLVVSALCGSFSVVLLSMVLEKLFQAPRLRAILWLGTTPLVLGWSLSIYNVIVPFFFVVLSLWYLVFRKSELLVFASFALAVSMRIELIVGLPFLLIWSWMCNRKSWWLLLSILPIISMLSMLGQEIPGEGERILALQNNWFLWEYYEPWYWFFPLLVWRLAHQKTWDIYLGGSLFFLILNHFLMSSFNDFSSRHLLISLIPVSFMLAEFLKTELFWIFFIVQAYTLVSYGSIFYADQHDFQIFLKEEYSDLSNYSLAEARSRGCAWVVELEPFVSEDEERILSHFNLLSFREREGLRKQYSCIDWCFTEQDWQWSSLGVRDRAIRLERLFELKEIGIVQVKDLQCLLYSVREK